MNARLFQALCCLSFVFWAPFFIAALAEDPRDIAHGVSIYEHGYCDQPYVVVMEDGAWVCVFTTSAEREGAASQYIVCSVSNDKGQTWSDPTPIESPEGPEASWAMPLLTHFGRIYVFYVYNGDDVRTLPDGASMRADTHGWYCYRYSDDAGATWSERYRLPMRVTAADRNNDFGGEVQMFWGIGKPVVFGDTAWFAFSKLSEYFLVDSEGWFYRSDNVLTEPDVERVVWELLPEGDYGLRHPDFGSVQEEHNIVPLSNGDLYCVYRTTLGYAVASYSRDGGRSWSVPEYMQYADGRPIKNPRACPRLWRCENGKYLFWFHNHSGTDFSERNPAWLSGGIERDGHLLWSEPEIVLYGEDRSYHTGRFSYPDLIEQDGRYWITTTQKTRATVHEVDASLLAGMWAQFEGASFAATPVVGWARDDDKDAAPSMTGLSGHEDAGFTIALEWTHAADSDDETWLLDGRDAAGRGVAVDGSGALILNDGADEVSLPLCGCGFAADADTHLVIIVDRAASIVSFVVDGRLCDGGETCQYGWQRLPAIGCVFGDIPIKLHASVTAVRIYERPLRTSEALAEKSL